MRVCPRSEPLMVPRSEWAIHHRHCLSPRSSSLPAAQACRPAELPSLCFCCFCCFCCFRHAGLQQKPTVARPSMPGAQRTHHTTAAGRTHETKPPGPWIRRCLSDGGLDGQRGGCTSARKGRLFPSPLVASHPGRPLSTLTCPACPPLCTPTFASGPPSERRRVRETRPSSS